MDPLKSDFHVSVPVERAWAVLTDVERIAPCLPGAQLEEIEGDEYRGIVKVKVGPITAQYKGKATFLERDDAGHRAVLRAEGRETRGQGNASATITATLTSEGDGTAVSVVTELTITGRVAEFGRGVLADVSAEKLLDQFVQCLETTVLAGEATPTPEQPAEATDTGEATEPAAEPPAAEASTGPRRIESEEKPPVDLLDTAGAPIAKRVGPVVAVIAALWLLRVFIRRRRRR